MLNKKLRCWNTGVEKSMPETCQFRSKANVGFMSENFKRKKHRAYPLYHKDINIRLGREGGEFMVDAFSPKKQVDEALFEAVLKIK